MRNLELRNAINYSKNVLSQVCGISGAREAINDLRRRGENRIGPKIIDGGFGVVAMVAVPAIRSMIFDSNVGDIKYATARVLAAFVGDFSSFIGAGLLIADGRAVEGVGMKVAYNAFVAAVPDMARPFKDALHRFKVKPPSITAI